MPFYSNVIPNNIQKDIFIETGTYKGDGVQKALQNGYKQVYSIELDDTLYNLCNNHFHPFH